MAPIHVQGTPADFELLAGRWQGEYDSPALGRHGTIEFTLQPGGTHAKGIVAMTPQGATKPYAPTSLVAENNATSLLSSQLLTIRFVLAEGGKVSGELDPYWDPDRNCEATTYFTGHLVPRVIEGSFTTRWDCGPGEASGRWQVTRK